MMHTEISSPRNVVSERFSEGKDLHTWKKLSVILCNIYQALVITFHEQSTLQRRL